jgi:hypothetical protein
MNMLDEAVKLKVYPSGFLGSTNVEQTKPLDVVSAAKMLFSRGVVKAPSPYSANMDVVVLWNEIISGTMEYKTFEFKERILKAAINAFGTELLIDWLSVQAQSPEFTDNHYRWIDETILFVFGGKRRELSSNNWRVILTAGGRDDTVDQFSPVVKSYILGENASRYPGAAYRGSMTIREFVMAWVRQQMGMEDMMASMDVLFGTR